MEALVPMEEHYVGTKNMALCFRRHHGGVVTPGVLNVFIPKDIVSGDGLTSLSTSVAKGVG